MNGKDDYNDHRNLKHEQDVIFYSIKPYNFSVNKNYTSDASCIIEYDY